MTDGYFFEIDKVRIHHQDHAPREAAGTPVPARLDPQRARLRGTGRASPRGGGSSCQPRGRGLSDRDSNAERYTLAVYVADTLALLDRLGVDRAVFVGTSMGGLYATMPAAARAATVGRLSSSMTWAWRSTRSVSNGSAATPASPNRRHLGRGG